MVYNLKTFESGSKSLKQKTVADSHLEENYIFLFDPDLRPMSTGSGELSQLNSLDKSSIQADQFIETYLQNSKECLTLNVDMIDFIREKALTTSLNNSLDHTRSRVVQGDLPEDNSKLFEEWLTDAKLACHLQLFNFFSDDFYLIANKIMTDSLINYPNKVLFASTCNKVTNLMTTRSFKKAYLTNSSLKAYVKNFAEYFSETLIPYLNELNVAVLKQNLDSIMALFNLIQAISHLAFKTKNEKMLLFIKRRIFRKEFVEKLFAILRVVESENAISDIVIKFLKKTIDMFVNHPLQHEFMSVLTLIFDSLMIVKNTDNFNGSSRLKNLLKLAHSLISRNKNLVANLHKTKSKELHTILETKLQINNVIKSTTVGWIVRLT